MLRALTPSLLVALIPLVAAGLAVELGGPIWLIYGGVLLAGALVLPAYLRWDERRFGS